MRTVVTNCLIHYEGLMKQQTRLSVENNCCFLVHSKFTQKLEYIRTKLSFIKRISQFCYFGLLKTVICK